MNQINKVPKKKRKIESILKIRKKKKKKEKKMILKNQKGKKKQTYFLMNLLTANCFSNLHKILLIKMKINISNKK